ncbi:high mobility group box domain-containing protein, partial [Mycena rebaudengoi]
VPRPPNCWILYRSDKRKELGKMHENEASKMISARWKSEVPHVRAKYEQLANEKKEEHTRMYPDYRFSPVKKEEKER